MKSYLCFGALLLSVGLFSCKPKDTTVTGQIFIVTRGAENVKLGAVEVLLVEKQQVAQFLEQRQPIVELEIASRQQALTDAKKDTEMARANFDSFEANKPNRFKGYKAFLANKIFSTYPDYTTIKSQIENLWRESEALSSKAKLISAQQDRLEEQGDYLTGQKLLGQSSALYDRASKLDSEADAKLDKLESFLNHAEAEKKNQLDAAESRVAIAQAKLDNSPTIEDYLLEFSQVVVQKTLTDADGKFSFAFPRNKLFAVFARAQRIVLDRTENYCWLVDALKNTDSAQLFLSNNNLVFVDPDGYFKTKPKPAM